MALETVLEHCNKIMYAEKNKVKSVTILKIIDRMLTRHLPNGKGTPSSDDTVTAKSSCKE